MACFPSIITAALFVAIIIFDLTSGSWRQIPGHALFGFFSVLVTNFICEKGSPVVAWILLLSPIVLIFVSYLIRLIVYYITKSGTGDYSDNTIPAQPERQLYVCETYPCKKNGGAAAGSVPSNTKPVPASTSGSSNTKPASVPASSGSSYVEPKNGACIKPSLA